MKEKNIALILIVLCSLAVLISLFKTKTAVKDNSTLDSDIISNAISSKKIKVLALDGMIFDSISSSSSPFKSHFDAATLKRDLIDAIKDENVKAIMLRVNSPGGTVATSQEIYNLVLKAKEKNKPVVVSMSDLCASGCYYIASAANTIVANKGSLTGSIGVISQGLNYKGLFDKLGLYDQTIKAGKFKDIGSGSREISLEEKQILQNLIDDSYDQFLEDINKARGIEMSKLKKIAQGLIYTGRQAKEVNLVDELGTYDDAKAITINLLKALGQAEADDYVFDEVWKKSKISSIKDFLSFNPFASLNFANFMDFFNLSAENQKILWLSR